MVQFIRSDLEFILQQIQYAEELTALTAPDGSLSSADILSVLPNVQVPWGLRTVDGSYNNLVFNENLGIDQTQYGAADTVFPRLLTPVFRTADAGTSYAQVNGTVIDAQPRIISNLIVDQTANNPAATAASASNGSQALTPSPGSTVFSPGLDGIFGTADDAPVYYIPNVTPDFSLTVPFNAWFTFFGQFFDHGLDLVTKGGQDIVFVPLQPDDPLYKPGSPTNFMVETRATNVAVHPGPDGVLGTADDIHDNQNTTTPFVDQNQTYTSHPSHQVFLRAYELLDTDPTAGVHLAPFATGKLIENRAAGADGQLFAGNDDIFIGGMSTWAVVKAQAQKLLGINLTDKDFDNVPLLATDAYGNFIPGANGLPQVVMSDGLGGTFLVEGNLASPIDLTNAVRTGHQFLIDIAHNAVPVFDASGNLAPDADSDIGNAQAVDPLTGQNLTYDDELLNLHYIAGDGRANENIGLTAVHSIFHSEHNRLVDQTKQVLVSDAIQAQDATFLNQWLLSPVAAALPGVSATQAAIDAFANSLIWNGERLFQAGRFGTEMQYQHLVFEEFARTVQPGVDEFLAPNGYDTTINPAIVAEFAHTVYRFGHSMLTETVDRFDPNFNVVGDPNSANPDQQLGLIAAFLNPLAFADSGPTPEEAVGAIVRGVTRTVGNEIDEFITEALRNNLVGLPLDLAVLNLARGRDTGIPSLNAARREFYAMTSNNDVGDQNVKPYISWADFVQHLKHPESLINFIAAYGTHAALLAPDVDTLVEKRAVAAALVLGGSAVINAGTPEERTFVADDADRLAFLNSTGVYHNVLAGPDGQLGTADDINDINGVTTTGVDLIDFWVGGLAEEQMPFGGLLGSSFNFVFENQLEALQNGDRFYYLSRTAGLNFGTELENNTFAQLVMLNTDATHLPADIFQTPKFILEVDQTHQFTGLGPDGRADPTGGITINGQEVTPLVMRDNPDTLGPDSNYLHYTGGETVVLGGTDNPDILIAGSSDDDTVYGDGGNDTIDGGFGNDNLFGGAGDDFISDMGGTDVIHGDAGNDTIFDGHSLLPLEVPNIILGGDGKDFIVTWDDVSMIFGGAGDDFMYGSKPNLPETGNEGDDWIELGTQDGSPGDNFSPFLLDEVPGNDIFVGGGGFDEMIGEGGDDIFVGSDAQDKMDGMSGFDWVTYKNDRIGVTVDLELAALNEPPVAASPASILDRFAEVEGLSGSKFADYLRGSEADANVIATFNAKTSALDAAGIARVSGLQGVLDHAFALDHSPGSHVTEFGTGNIILGGDGSDIILGLGGDDVIDGDAWLNVRISVRANVDGTGAEIASYDSMAQMIPLMLAGTYNPGQLVAVREVLAGSGGFDTAVLQGNRLDYSVTINDNGTLTDFSDDVVTVVDNVVGRDGTDRLTHVERLVFADQTVELTTGLDAGPAGTLTIADLNGGVIQTGDFLRASIAGVTDADNVSATNPTGAITGPIRYTWQAEFVPGSGVFDDIILLPGGDLAFESASGAVFRALPLVDGLSLRVKAIYEDAHGVTEMVFSDPTAPVVAVAQPPVTTQVTPGPVITEGGEGVHLVRSDLDFILKQIKIGEAHAAGTPLQDLIPNIRLAYGLRSVDGSENNLLDLNGINQSEFGAADTTFPRLLPPNFHAAEAGTSYAQTTGTVIDSQPRTISNLVVDQTANNPAAYAAAVDPGADGVLNFGIAIGAPGNDDVLKDGVEIVKSPGLDGVFGTIDDRDVFYFPNVAPDFGLTAPFNAWFTFFGQFFDHGLDLVTKGGNGTIFVPLKADDPLVAGADGIFGTSDDLPPQLRFMVETRATMRPGPDGVLGTADDVHEQENTTTPFVDQNQTYTSHPSHQVFLRAYQMQTFDPDGSGPLGPITGPVATGKLITNRDLGADGKFGTSDDTEIGGMSTWKVVKAQARDLLGINLTDKDFDNVPLLATDQYGNFIKGPHGFPQVIMKGADGLAGTADDILVEGNPAAPIDLTNAVRTGHQFLIDVAHNAAPVLDAAGQLVPDADHVAGNAVAFNPLTGQNLEYDDELLDAHYIAGDGRVNENIGLTAVHSIFHSEHNRLVDQAKDTVLASNDLAFLNEWLLNPVAAFPTSQAQIDQLVWNGERLFQVAKFGTEVQYQHLVFEEFARTIQPLIDPFFAPTQVYDVDLNPAIVAEFAHTVYRFGHSMLTETVDRFDANFNVVGDSNPTEAGNQQMGLIAAFLNPLAFVASGPTPEDATSAIVRGVTRTVGNEIDEFVTEALRNNLLGTPLDLAVLNLARGRDTGIPTLQAARRDFYQQTGDSWEKPYTSWADLVQHLKHPESLVNFIAAYGAHAAVTSETTLAGKRAAALLLVLGDGNDADGVTINGVTYTDRLDFLNATGAWADSSAAHPKDLDGVSVTGLGNIDLWIGGLAEQATPFGGLLGSTFNFVFENTLEKLQDGDRFYYLERTSGLSFGNELEFNSFAKLIMANTNAVHLPGDVFQAVGYTLEVDQSKQYTGLGADGRDDPTGGVIINGQEIAPLVIRDNPNTSGPDSNYLQYAGDHIHAATVVLGGTDGNDILIAGDSDDDTVWGDGGNDTLDGGYGDDFIRGGAGDDLVVDSGGSDEIQGGDGNDVIQAGSGTDLIFGGFGKDFIITGEDNDEAFGGAGDDFILGNKSNEQDIGNEGDDWLEKGTSDGAPGDNFDPLGLDPVIGNDIFIGDGENDKFIGEGGDDIMVGSTGLTDRSFGGSGFDWADFKNDAIGVTIDIDGRFFDQPPVPGSGASALARFDIVEGLSGSSHNDFLFGDSAVDLVGGEVGGAPGGSALTNIALINGLQGLLNTAFGAPVTAFTTGNIILGGDGSDVMMGRGGDDIIDGDAWLNVRISVHQNVDGTGPQIATFDSMQDMVPFMLNGTYKVGQLQAVREILYSDAANFDTAKFAGPLANYTITIDDKGTASIIDDVVTVTDNVGLDGIDRVMHIERLQFSDQSIVLGGLNHEPVGSLLLSGTPTEGTPVTVSIADVTDADNESATNPDGNIPPPVAYFWQVERQPGVFEDITVFAAGEVSRIEGTTFTPTDNEVGLNLRVRAVYQDGNGVLEEVFSAPQLVANVNDAPVGTVLISDTTPTETLTLTAANAFTDADGLTAAVFTYQWERLDGATWVQVGTASTVPQFTPTQAEVGHQLRVVVSYTDDHGTAETVTSAPTGIVGDFFNGNAAANTFNGTAGDDLALGNGGDDTLNGLAGSDTLNGGAGSDVLNGGAGLDVLIGGAGNDTMSGGTEGDSLDGGAGADNLNGDAGNDTITGGAGNDVINAGADDDTINYTMGDGADTVIGDVGTDTLNIIGTPGADTLDVVFNGTVLTGVEGGTVSGIEAVTANLLGSIDTLSYGTATTAAVAVNLETGSASGFTSVAGIENVTGGSGSDTLTGDGLGNALTGGAGNDTLTGGAGNDTLTGGTGTDTASYADSSAAVVVNLATGTAQRGTEIDALVTMENVIGGSGGDSLTGSTGANLLDGGAGNDALDGGSGNDTLLGGLGADSLLGGIGNDSIMGGAGNDVITYNFGDGTDVLVDGGADSDTLAVVGTAANNALSVTWNGAAITALTGITAITGVEHVTASLGGGTDTLSYTTASNVAVNLATGSATGFSTAAGSLLGAISGIENVTTGSGNDTLTGDAAANVLAGGAGSDTYFVGAGDTVTENNVVGIDTVNSTVSFTLGANVENLNLTALANINGTGNGGANVITDLGGGNNVLSGQGGTDTLDGGAGADTLDGGAGNDVLIGGADNDSMTGGGNSDVFVFATGFGNDVITDFDANGNGTLANQDLLDISTYDPLGADASITAGNFASHVSILASAGNTTVTIDGNTILLQGVSGVGNNVITVTDFLLHL